MRYATALLLLFVVLLAGCGQKGPLYLPADEPAQPAAADSGEQAEQVPAADADAAAAN